MRPKLAGHTLNAASSVPCLYAAFKVSPNLFIRFLIDTGASLSIFPARHASALNVMPSSVKLSSVDGKSVAVHGEVHLSISSSDLRRAYQWCFIVADVAYPIIGADFLAAHKISVNCSQMSIIDDVTLLRSKCRSGPHGSSAPILALPQSQPDVAHLLKRFSSVFQPIQFSSDSTSKVQHFIETSSNRPVFARARQLKPDLLASAKEEFRKLMELGIIRPSKSPWASPLHMVKKGDGTWRPCGDYRALNSITTPDRYPVPHVQHLLQRFHGCSVFSKVDLIKAYHQIAVAECDIPKTAITTPFGLFEYTRMPFGLRNASQTFQRHMDNIFRDLPFVCVYIDDILIASSSFDEHIQHLQSVLQRLSDHNLKVSASKSVFAEASVSFLGCTLSNKGIRPDAARSEAIINFPSPQTFTDLRRFMGMAGYYRRFIPHFSEAACPLQELITQYDKKPKDFKWSKEADDAFNDIKKRLAECVTLSPIKAGSNSFQLVTDASSSAIGAALHQRVNDDYVPIAFFSKKLSAPQRVYSAYDRELLAAFLAVVHFRPLIDGQQVVLVTDHKPLVTAFYSQTPAKSDRQQRHLMIITEHVSQAIHIKGSNNVVADALSRSISSVQLDSVDLSSICEAQQKDNEIGDYKDRLTAFPLAQGQIWCDTSTIHPRPFLPAMTRTSIFNQLHSLAHPGIKGSQRLIAGRYFWPSMNADIKQWCKECAECQQSKVGRHVKSPLQSFDLPVSNRFEAVHMDIVGPLPVSNDLKYVVTFIDRATRWCEAQPVPNIEAETVAMAFLSSWVSRFGVPLYLITDRGKQFESELFKKLSEIVGFHRLRTTAYHPQTNGMIERVHRTIKAALKARGGDWYQSLPIVLLGLRAIPNESGLSPFTILTGTTLLVPAVQKSKATDIEFVKNLARTMKQLDYATLSEGRIHGPHQPYIPQQLRKATKVWLRVDRVRRALEAPYSGPFNVISWKEKTVLIEKEDGNHETVSIDRIKPAVLKPVKQQPPAPKRAPPPDEEGQPKAPENAQPDKSSNSTRTGRRVQFPKKLHQYLC